MKDIELNSSTQLWNQDEAPINLSHQVTRELRASIKVKLKELGHEGSGDIPTPVLRKLSDLLDMDYRSLRGFYLKEDGFKMNARTARNLIEAFQYVKQNKVTTALQLYNILTDRDCKRIVTEHAFPKEDSLSTHASSIKFGIQTLRELFDKAQNISTDHLDRIDELLKFEIQVSDEFEKLKNKNIILLSAKIPSYNQPPAEMEVTTLISAFAFLIVSGVKKADGIVTYVDWNNIY